MRLLVRAGLALLGVVLLSFVLTRALPGDPLAVLGAAPGMGPAELEALRRELGLDQPLTVQFFQYLGAVLQGDLGQSRVTGQTVLAAIGQRLPASVELAGAGFVLALGVVLGLGLAALARPGGLADRAARGLAVIGGALPVFVLGLLLVQVFYVWLAWAPEPSGRMPPLAEVPLQVTGFVTVDAVLAGDLRALGQAAGQLVLPALTMALFGVAPMLRMFRAAGMAALAGPGVVGARALGIPERVVLWRYALPEAVGPLVPVAVLTFGYMLAAGVLVETIFAWPGIGRFALEALGAMDHASVQGVMLVLAAVQVVCAGLAEGLARWLDPRVAG